MLFEWLLDAVCHHFFDVAVLVKLIMRVAFREPHLVQVLQTLKAAVIFLASLSSHLSAVRA